jgi:polyhydroxyalkanoate synthesis regulator phasin
VVSLIKRIRTTIETEGKQEAAEYDKYACFCKDEASDKQYAIDKAHELEARLSARIEEATGMKESTDQAIEKLEDEVAQLDTDVADANSTRESEHADYLSHTSMLDLGISGIENATKTVEAGLAGPALLQQLAAEFVQTDKVPAKKGDNAVLETLETLKVQFREAIVEADKEEIETQNAYEMMQGKRKNQKTAKLHNIEQHNATSAQLSVEIAEREQAKSESETARAADEGFLADISAKCEAKATAWDARSKVRSGELVAMEKAIELLAPAAETYGATDDQATALGLGLAAKTRSASKRPPSFLQVGAKLAEVRRARIVHTGKDRVVSTLSKVSSSSSRVQAIVAAAKDSSMDEVANMVQELIDDLVKEGEDADAEAVWCEEEMLKALEAKNETLAELAELNTTISVKSSERDELTVEIATLAHELAEIAKALNEETVLYNEEKVRLAKKLTDSTIGEKAVSDAISVLEEYYQGVAVFAQQTTSTRKQGKDEPIDASVETFSNDQYGGSQSSASHVIGLLNEIKDDFTQAIDDSKTGETTADSDFADYQSESESSTEVKTDAKETKEEEKAAAELAISDAVTAEENAEKVLAQREELIEKIKPGCTAAGIAAADRATQREAEKSALGEALSILQSTDFNSTGF